MATTEGNGRTPQLFNPGRLAFTVEVYFTLVSVTASGKGWLDYCLERHIHGDWGDCSPAQALGNRRDASDSALKAGGLVTGVYTIPTRLRRPVQPDNTIWLCTAALLGGPITTVACYASELQ